MLTRHTIYPSYYFLQEHPTKANSYFCLAGQPRLGQRANHMPPGGLSACHLRQPFFRTPAHHPIFISAVRGCRHASRAFLLDQDCGPVARTWEETELGWGSFESYRRWSLIGCGTSAQVHVATRIDSRDQMAVKTLPKVVGKTPRSHLLHDIRLEALVLERLQSCTGVARLIDRCEDAKYAYLITELCRGGDLRRYVEGHGPLTEQRLACVAVQVLRIVRHCHDLGVLHGDVKPSNFCLVDAQAFDSAAVPVQTCLRGIDFGCSRLLGAGQRTTAKAVGSYAFLAPEAVEQDYGLKADVWSVGVLLYWLFAYRFPFMDTALLSNSVNPEDVRCAVLHAPILLNYGPWLKLSPDGLDFINGCLRRNEDERMGVEQALQHPWIKRMVMMTVGSA